MKKYFMYNVIIVLLLFSSFQAYGQVKISNTPVSIPTNGSLLELDNSNNSKGFLLTRLNLQSTTVPAPLSAHVKGMIVYNTSTAGVAPNNVTKGLYYNDGTKWIKLSSKKPHIGDIKQGFQSSDHSGWYLLDGRVLTLLPLNQRNNAIALGLSSNLPNSSDSYLKNTNGTDTLANNGGADSFTLTQSNLPNIDFTGSTTTNGSHTHTYTDNTTTANNVASGTNNPIANTTSTSSITSTSGNHSHTLNFSLGGNSQPIVLKPDYIVTNTFIYLGN